ncbi:MAG TPA: VanZ family protein [bacterium]|nr:VanZ family protein [bacterium]
MRSKTPHILADNRSRIALFAIYLAYVLILTLKPFDFSAHWIPLFLHNPAGELFGVKVYDLINNVLLFMPLGFLLGVHFGRSRERRASLLIRVTLTGALLSMGIETAQIFLERTTSAIDVMTNTSGTALGCTLASYRIWERSFAVQAIRIWHMRRFRILFATCYAAVLAGILFAPVRWNRFDTWDDSYPFLLGNEGTDDRPWRGEIHSLLIFDRALPPGEIASLASQTADGLSPSRVAGLRPVAAFPFDDEGRVARNPADPDNSLRLTGEGVERLRDRPGIRFDGGKVSSRQLGKTLTERLKAASQLTISLWLRPADPEQVGPARIVSISRNPERRNVTLGQEGRRLTLRVRTPQTWKNASRIPLYSDRVFEDTRYRHVAATFHHGVARVYVDGVPAGRPLYAHRHYLPHRLEFGTRLYGWFACCFIFFWPLTQLVYSIPVRRRFIGMMLVMAGYVALIDSLYWFFFGQPFGPFLLMPVAGVSLIAGRAGRFFSGLHPGGS